MLLVFVLCIVYFQVSVIMPKVTNAVGASSMPVENRIV